MKKFVTEIDSEGNNLVGHLPNIFWKLPYLKRLNLKENFLSDVGFDGLDDAKPPLVEVSFAHTGLPRFDGIDKMPQSLKTGKRL